MLITRASDPYRRDFKAGFSAIRKLLANGDDTAQVFIIMRALNGPSVKGNFARLMQAPDGPRMIYRRVELAERLSDAGFVASFAPGTVGAAYRAFLEQTGYSADGLAEVSRLNHDAAFEHPYGWVKRRIRDVHDLWHILTGYQADEHLGEAALVAFSHAQTGGLGWAFIALAASLKSLQLTRGTAWARAVLEGHRRGRRAEWLLGEDVEQLLHEPLAAARIRLGITEPVAYRLAQAHVGAMRAGVPSGGRSTPA